MRIEGKGHAGGSVNEAVIDAHGNIHVASQSRPARLVAADSGNAFWIHSGFVPFTTTVSFSGLIYVKNTSTVNEIHIANIRTCSTAASPAFVQYRIIKDPTLGTLITAGTPVVAVNSRFASTTPLDALVLSGADLTTVTDGVEFGTWTDKSPGHSFTDTQGTIIIGPGHSIAVTVQPSVASTICTTWQVWTELPN